MSHDNVGESGRQNEASWPLAKTPANVHLHLARYLEIYVIPCKYMIMKVITDRNDVSMFLRLSSRVEYEHEWGAGGRWSL
jgi:hypothetical protein